MLAVSFMMMRIAIASKEVTLAMRVVMMRVVTMKVVMRRYIVVMRRKCFNVRIKVQVSMIL